MLRQFPSLKQQNLQQNLNVAYASNDPQIIAEAWSAIDAARAETAHVSAQASHAIGSLQSQLETADRDRLVLHQENQRIREEAARQAANAENQASLIRQEAHRAVVRALDTRNERRLGEQRPLEQQLERRPEVGLGADDRVTHGVVPADVFGVIAAHWLDTSRGAWLEATWPVETRVES